MVDVQPTRSERMRAGMPRRATWARLTRGGAIASAALLAAGIGAMLLAAVVGQRGLLSLPSLVMLVLGVAGLAAIAAAASALRRFARTGVDVDQELRQRPPVVVRVVLATVLLALGLAGIAFGGLMLALTANPRSLLALGTGLVLALVALALHLRLSRALRSAPAAEAIG